MAGLFIRRWDGPGRGESGENAADGGPTEPRPAFCGNRALGLTVPGNAIELVSLLRRGEYYRGPETSDEAAEYPNFVKVESTNHMPALIKLDL